MQRAPKVYLRSVIIHFDINDLKNANALDQIMFADDANLFISDKNFNTLSKGKFRAAKNE